jgi:hypothetical protein
MRRELMMEEKGEMREQDFLWVGQRGAARSGEWRRVWSRLWKKRER